MAKIEKIGNTQVIDNKEDNFFYFPMISMACTGYRYTAYFHFNRKTEMVKERYDEIVKELYG